MDKNVARVAVSAATFHIDRPYDYLIPTELIKQAKPGIRVLVPFGRGNKSVEGVLLSVENNSSFDKLKNIVSFLDTEPVLSDEHIRLALKMSDRFFCTVYDALRIMLPKKLDFKRTPKLREIKPVNKVSIELNKEQKKSYEGLLPLLENNTPEAALLYGVTGSGKTLVYMKLIDAALLLGKTAIVLVPEIALTPQMVNLFESHLGDAVAVIHSRLGAGERYNEWLRTREGKVRVVVGTRSAVFAPLENIGLIVIDEEQEHTYKSDNSPRYHAREIAKHRITHTAGLLLLASATPSVESMYNAKSEKYKLFNLRQRFNEKDMPPVILVDMKNELKSGNNSIISSVLRDELQKNMDNGEQSILFINRRGASPLVACGECGYTFKCRDCNVSMTYHISGKRLLCHYCSFSVAVPSVCPDCEGRLKFIGAGTQKIEHELMELFPEVRILRMDADTTTRKDSHDKILAAFRNKKADILLGTQMVTKGLDFENVTLVGVISADTSLYMSDYRAYERTFSLITQVVGRSGRGEKPGRAVIQTFTPNHRIISLASSQDYDTFYKNEIEMRRALGCPPIRDLLTITAVGENENNVARACDIMKTMLNGYFKKDKNIRLLGPAPATVSKVKNQYFYKLLINCENNKRTRETIAHVTKEFVKDKRSRGVAVYVDTDDVNM
ncbi:MAG: primosomal protein N' [Oscillospiraceae bacterium]|nr:primosomal protein N' [Oscillospiraceae bacterium]